jgi:hypothetical protein
LKGGLGGALVGGLTAYGIPKLLGAKSTPALVAGNALFGGTLGAALGAGKLNRTLLSASARGEDLVEALKHSAPGESPFKGMSAEETRKHALRSIILHDLKAGKAVGASPEQQKKEYERLSKEGAADDVATGLGALGLGYGLGSRAAGASARATAPPDQKDRAESIARKLAIVGVPLATVLAAFVGKAAVTPLIDKALKSLSSADLIFLAKAVATLTAGAAGGVISGGAIGSQVGGAMRLRKKLKPEEKSNERA